MGEVLDDFKNNEPGFTLIEMLVFLFIFSLITVTFYETWSVGTRHILLAKNKLVASALANEKMELIRNLAYDDIELTTSTPSGIILQDENVMRSGKTYHVFTQIKKEDDPFDGTLGGSPNDTNFVDYKLVKITVSWEGGSQSISASSRFVPAGIEQPILGQGVLVVNVTSDKAGGVPIANSSVRIRKISGGYDETHSTDSFGRLVLVGIPQSIEDYEVTLSKIGYENVSTIAPYPIGPYDPPVHEHASVVENSINTIDMFQNQLSDLNIKTVNYLGEDVPNVSYFLEGGRKLGLAPSTGQEIYNLENHDETDSEGEKNYEDISPGISYKFALEESGYKIIGTDPVVPFPLIPGATETLTVKVSPDNVTSLLVKVIDNEESGLPISGASIKLTNGAGYDTTIVTQADGMAFFPIVADPPFDSGTYDLSITASGLDDYSGQVTVDSGELKEEVIEMSPL